MLIPQPRLESSKSFLTTIQPIKNSPEKETIDRRKEREQNTTREIKEELPNPKEWTGNGGKWKALDRLRTGVGRCKTTLKKWNILGDDETTNCKCGETQIMDHLLQMYSNRDRL